jgi:hypothetical protein
VRRFVVSKGVKDRKSNRLRRSIHCREPLIKALLGVGRDKMPGSEGPFRVWEGARQGDFLAKIRRISPRGQQRARQAPGGCSPRYALIEIVLWLRLSNGIAPKALFIEKASSAGASSSTKTQGCAQRAGNATPTTANAALRCTITRFGFRQPCHCHRPPAPGPPWSWRTADHTSRRPAPPHPGS